MRERLIQLLSDEICPSPLLCDKNCKYAHSGNCYADRVADHLLANGVILPPCKVGDVVYVVKPYFSFIQEYQVRGYHLGEFPTLNGHKRKSYLICYHKASSALKHLPIDEIGKTVFFNREEAEAKLKGGATE